MLLVVFSKDPDLHTSKERCVVRSLVKKSTVDDIQEVELGQDCDRWTSIGVCRVPFPSQNVLTGEGGSSVSRPGDF